MASDQAPESLPSNQALKAVQVSRQAAAVQWQVLSKRVQTIPRIHFRLDHLLNKSYSLLSSYARVKTVVVAVGEATALPVAAKTSVLAAAIATVAASTRYGQGRSSQDR